MHNHELTLEQLVAKEKMLRFQAAQSASYADHLRKLIKKRKKALRESKEAV